MHIKKDFIDETITSWDLSNLQDVTVTIETRELKTFSGYIAHLFRRDPRPAELLFTAKAFSAGRELGVVEVTINESSRRLQTTLKESLMQLDTLLDNRKIVEE